MLLAAQLPGRLRLGRRLRWRPVSGRRGIEALRRAADRDIGASRRAAAACRLAKARRRLARAARRLAGIVDLVRRARLPATCGDAVMASAALGRDQAGTMAARLEGCLPLGACTPSR